MQNPREILKQGVLARTGNQKEAARRLGVDDTLLSKIFSNVRPIAPDIEKEMAAMSLTAGMAIMAESTGYVGLFVYHIDRHPQNLTRLLEVEDIHADQSVKNIAFKFLVNPAMQNLTEGELAGLQEDVLHISHRIQADLNLLAEVDTRCPQLMVTALFSGKKEKARVRAS